MPCQHYTKMKKKSSFICMFLSFLINMYEYHICWPNIVAIYNQEEHSWLRLSKKICIYCNFINIRRMSFKVLTKKWNNTKWVLYSSFWYRLSSFIFIFFCCYTNVKEIWVVIFKCVTDVLCMNIRKWMKGLHVVDEYKTEFINKYKKSIFQ